MQKRKEPVSVNTPDGVLARLKHKLGIALKVDNHKLRILIDRFVMKVFNGVQNSSMHYDKINTYNELNKPRMTIKVFFKYLRILDIKKVTFSVTVETSRGVVVTVSEEFNNFSNDTNATESDDE